MFTSLRNINNLLCVINDSNKEKELNMSEGKGKVKVFAALFC